MRGGKRETEKDIYFVYDLSVGLCFQHHQNQAYTYAFRSFYHKINIPRRSAYHPFDLSSNTCCISLAGDALKVKAATMHPVHRKNRIIEDMKQKKEMKCPILIFVDMIVLFMQEETHTVFLRLLTTWKWGQFGLSFTCHFSVSYFFGLLGLFPSPHLQSTTFSLCRLCLLCVNFWPLFVPNFPVRVKKESHCLFSDRRDFFCLSFSNIRNNNWRQSDATMSDDVKEGKKEAKVERRSGASFFLFGSLYLSIHDKRKFPHTSYEAGFAVCWSMEYAQQTFSPASHP